MKRMNELLHVNICRRESWQYCIDDDDDDVDDGDGDG